MKPRAASIPALQEDVTVTEQPAEALRRPETSAEEALKRLKEGNARFVAGTSRHADLDARRRAETVSQGQHPLAAILSCSDSRVPPEIVFDQGIGRLYVTRVAGNVCGREQVASLEYALTRLAMPLLIVMGHTLCGAVAAALGTEAFPESMQVILKRIGPVAAKVRRETVCLDEAHLADTVVEANVWQTIDELLKESRTIYERAASGQLTVVGAKYDTLSGRVHWLGQRRVESWDY